MAVSRGAAPLHVGRVTRSRRSFQPPWTACRCTRRLHRRHNRRSRARKEDRCLARRASWTHVSQAKRYWTMSMIGSMRGTTPEADRAARPRASRATSASMTSSTRCGRRNPVCFASSLPLVMSTLAVGIVLLINWQRGRVGEALFRYRGLRDIVTIGDPVILLGAGPAARRPATPAGSSPG